MNVIVPGSLQALVERRLRLFEEAGMPARLWAHDPALWKEEPAHRKIIEGSLGWLDVVDDVRDDISDLLSFAAEVSAEGYRDAVLLGMGGSSLAPEVMHSALGAASDCLGLTVLDTTDPRAIAAADARLRPEHTLFIVASKSGGTTETASLHAYFYQRLCEALGPDEAGRHFAAITDEGTSLQRQAQEQGFRAVFINPSDIGGRYSALSFFGLVPAALIGVDIGELLDRAVDIVERCAADVPAADSPGLLLGAALGELALQGRDKLSIVASPGIAGLGSWIEQLVAESTGKEGVGILPVDAEPLGSAGVYGDDRAFVYIRLADGAALEQDAWATSLEDAGLPVLRLALRDAYDLGAQFFLWEVAVAAAGAVLGIDPFDQPNVQESKDNTRRVLAEGEEGRAVAPPVAADSLPIAVALDDPEAERVLDDLLAGLRPPRYVALQAWLTPTREAWLELQEIRRMVRDARRVATTQGFGPRFLHSTGQYHKGGPAAGVFVQIISESADDLEIPGAGYGFRRLKSAQALGDLQALLAHGGRVVRIDVGAEPVDGLRRLAQVVRRALGT